MNILLGGPSYFMNYLIDSIRLLTIVALAGAPIAALAEEAPARSAWRLFLSECKHVLQNPQTYLNGDVGAVGELTFKQSPDGQGLAINKTIGDLYVTVFTYRFADREVRDCAVYMTNPSGIDIGQYAAEFTGWLSDDLDYEVVGGHAPLYTDEYVMGVLGAWRQYDLDTRVRIDPYETQFFVLRTEMMQ